ncbi:PepSY1/2 domain-containing protein [Alicyclobacillus sp. SO9]|uniref:PepSY1/2 domain-containing protein n=1 Tax=Alicyclobacillus sp. SO9 TaxID=2665646 RepID=UPI0018E704B6|nr:PepSY1/2 domain-containing protein [Alicyclobacillus sp. SO9]QQE76833.1 germination protein YpeB [Alicyclobacillus sp. SO9]
MTRTKWLIVPVAALVFTSLGLGWWGTSERTQKQAMANEVESRYSNSFHELVSHVQDMQDEISKARVSADAQAFHHRVRSIWRLSGLAQDEVGKIPVEMMPMHETQSALAGISKKTETWLNTSPNPSTTSVQSGLDNMYKESNAMLSRLDKLQSTIVGRQLHWTAALAALKANRSDNQIVDGFRQIDKSMGAFVETNTVKTHPHKGAMGPFRKESTVSEAQAKDVCKSFMPTAQSLQAQRIYNPKLDFYEYELSGRMNGHSIDARVSERGGHMLSYRVNRDPATATVSFADAKKAALSYLSHHKFTHLSETDAYQFQNLAYFVFNPMRNGALVINQPIVVEMALDNGQLLGLNAQQYYLQPVANVPQRRYSAAQLKNKINPKAHVEMVSKTLVLDDAGHYQPADSFYVTREGKTFRIDVNAATGRELDTVDLSTK